MDKIENKKTIININKHKFYCDNCNVFLGESEECEDGYYREFGELELNFFLDNGWYKFNKHLCVDCRIKFLNNLKQILKQIGFKKE